MEEDIERVFEPWVNAPLRKPFEGSLAGLSEIWGDLSYFRFESEEDQESLRLTSPEDMMLRSLQKRDVPVREQGAQLLNDPPRMVELEERIPHVWLQLLGDVMKLGGSGYAFRYHVEAYDYKLVCGRERLQRVVSWSADMMGCASGERLESMVEKTIDELMEGFAEGFKRDNPQFADRPV